jgi:hypothetical protein
LFRKVRPARKRREVQALRARVLKPVEGFSSMAGCVLLSPVEPESRRVFALDQRSRDVDSGPILRTCDETLFATIREEIPESRDLGIFLSADDDGLVSPRPDLVLPFMETTDLSGDVGGHISHESREPVGGIDVEQKVEVIRGEHVPADAHLVQTLGSPEDADDDLVEHGGRPKEETALEGPAGDLDQGAIVGNEAEGAAHTRNRT